MNEGQRSYQDWREGLLAAPSFRAVYETESAKKELWLQLVEARQRVGLTQEQLAERLGVTQSQVARIEKKGYESYTLTTLRRYVQALGQDYRLEVNIEYTPHAEQPTERAAR